MKGDSGVPLEYGTVWYAAEVLEQFFGKPWVRAENMEMRMFNGYKELMARAVVRWAPIGGVRDGYVNGVD